MSRYFKKIKIGYLNIKVQPHPEGIYRQLFHNLARLKPAQIAGTSYGTIVLFPPNDNYERPFLAGKIYRFLNINARDNWLDTRNKEPIEQDPNDPPIVAEHLKPNLKEHLFVFFLDCHRLFYESFGLSPKRAAKFLQNLSNNSRIVNQFGRVDIEAVTSTDKIEREMKRLKTTQELLIQLCLVNDDRLNRFEKEIMGRLKSENVRDYKEIRHPLRGEKIIPSDETRALIALATAGGNGYVAIKGKDIDDSSVTISSRDHPKEYTVEHHTDGQRSLLGDIIELGAEITEPLLQSRRRSK